MTFSVKIVMLFSILTVQMGNIYASTDADTGSDCGSIQNAYGPFDYTDPSRKPNLRLVEGAHFTNEVKQLIKGKSSYLMGDIDYTLRAFPNHHQALYSMMNYRLKNPWTTTAGQLGRSADCYFKRAIEFKRDDPTVRMIYGIYLHKKKQYESAIAQYLFALKAAPDYSELLYNIGLSYFENNEHDQALKYAKKAYALGYPLPGLKNKLTQSGKWQE